MTDKFLGEMTKEEFLEALKIIIKAEDPDKEKPTTFREKIINFFKEIGYFFSKQLLIDIKNDIVDTVKFILNLKNLPRDVKKKIDEFAKGYKAPLTKELFIKRGIKVKFFLYDLIETFVFVIIAVIVIRMYVAEVRWIPSGSMKPTLLEHDRIIVERYSRFNSTPERGDIMVFYPPFVELENTPILVFKRLTGFFCEDKAYIKRVIGLPGEKFEIKRDKTGAYAVYINDVALDEPYIKSKYEFTRCERPEVNCGPFIIPENNYMMLGDNRGDSYDSRFWGPLDASRFIGRTTYRFWPLNRIKFLGRKTTVDGTPSYNPPQ